MINPATSASGERSFFTDRRLKTCFRSTMRQERFSNLTILNCHKERKAQLSPVVIANDVFDRNSNRKRDFGIFKESDTENINLLPHLGLYRLMIISIRLDAPFIRR